MTTSMESLFGKLDAIQGEEGTLRKVALIREALGTIEAEHGHASLEYAAALNELGTCYRSAADYEQAATYFEQAMDILEHVEGPASPEYAMALMNYAGVVRLQGLIDESLDLFVQARDLFADSLGPDSMEYLTALNNEALCYQDAGDYERALVNHLTVCSALERMGEGSVAYATSLYNTGFCFKQQGEEDVGDELIRRSLEVYRQLLPDGHELVEHAKAALVEGEPREP